MLKLVNTHGQIKVDRGMGGQTVKYVEHYTDDGVPVRVTIKDDRSYSFQASAKIERWTDSAGYQVVATLDPEDVHRQTYPENDGAQVLAEQLVDTYTELQGG